LLECESLKSSTRLSSSPTYKTGIFEKDSITVVIWKRIPLLEFFMSSCESRNDSRGNEAC
jgi:hypothetical protein